ncbi:hypothetical protein PSTT_03618 [Puccinia striiformis]|uniref:Uncharacterized protein n=1 Tax=Puccinia striiformis TaxID=27350 RepID=A0A2S4VVN6_9BASI|nr:hypothetical protein PSTT_03618 [Puccinia striiformis]
MRKLKVSNFEDSLDHPENLIHEPPVTADIPLKKSHRAQASKAQLKANYIAGEFDNIKGTKEIGDLIGGESIDGQLDMLYKCVVKFKSSEEYQSQIQKEANYQDNLQREMDRILSLKKTRPTKQSLQPAEDDIIFTSSEREGIAAKPVEEEEAEERERLENKKKKAADEKRKREEKRIAEANAVIAAEEEKRKKSAEERQHQEERRAAAADTGKATGGRKVVKRKEPTTSDLLAGVATEVEDTYQKGQEIVTFFPSIGPGYYSSWSEFVDGFSFLPMLFFQFQNPSRVEIINRDWLVIVQTRGLVTDIVLVAHP